MNWEENSEQLKVCDLTVHFMASACNLWSSKNYPFLLECIHVILDNFPVYSYKKL